MGGIPSRDTLGEGYLANRQGGGNAGHVLVQDRHRLGASSFGQRGTFARPDLRLPLEDGDPNDGVDDTVRRVVVASMRNVRCAPMYL